MKRNTIKKIAVALVILTTAISCSKQEDSNPRPVAVKVQYENYDQLLAFFSWCIQVPTDSIKLDPKTNELYVPNTIVREKLERIRQEYEQANIYKENFEKK